MAMESVEIERLIKNALPDARVELNDLRGDGETYAAYVESEMFLNKTRIEQHKMVYAALQGRLGCLLHALALTTSVPQAQDQTP